MDKRKPRKTLIGRVVSDKMDKTVTVSVERLFRHPRYKKIVKRTAKLYAHDEANRCRVGDKIKVMSTRPFSNLKRWRVIEVIEKAQ